MGSETHPRVVCRCLGVASPRLFAAARAEDLRSVADVTKSLRAGAGCTLCHAEIEEILAELRGEPVDAALARENRDVCRQETLARVERALLGVVAATQARIAGIVVDGLAVRVEVSGSASAALTQRIRDALHRGVCVDLEVEVVARVG
jgi:NAD(P)H-nitrite reductase large subunit